MEQGVDSQAESIQGTERDGEMEIEREKVQGTERTVSTVGGPFYSFSWGDTISSPDSLLSGALSFPLTWAYVVLEASISCDCLAREFIEFEPGIGFPVRVVAWDPRILSSNSVSAELTPWG